MNRSLYAVALLGFVVACQDSRVTAPSSNVGGALLSVAAASDASDPVTYFAPRTVAREGGAPQSVQFALTERDHSLFMEPFVLHVRANGDRPVVGTVLVDGTPVLTRRELVGLGAEPRALEVPVGPASVVTVQLEGPPGSSLTFSIEAPLQPPPVITITSPARHAAGEVGIGQPGGAFLQQGTLLPSPVEITGTACHIRYPITELEVAGVPVPVSGSNLCEPFTVVQQSRWGMSIITGTARNARGRVGTVAQAYTRSPEYYALANDVASAARIPGLFAQLNQPGLDDGDRATLNDVATFLEQRLNATVFSVPPATLIACTLDLFEVARSGGSFGQSFQVNFIRVSQGATQTVLDIDVSVLGPSLGVVARADLNFVDGNCTGGVVLNGAISASVVRLTAKAALVFPTSPTDPTVAVSFEDVGVQVTGTTVTLQSSDFSGPIVNALEGIANGVIGQHLLEVFRPVISDLVESFADAQAAATSHDVSINSASLRVTSGLQSILLGGASPNGFLRWGQFAQVAPLTLDPSAHAQLGALRALCGTELLPCPLGGSPSPAFSATAYAFGLAVHQDVLNHTLWSAWRGGAFNVLNLSALPGIGSGTLDALSMSVRATMPPVSMASVSDDPMIELAWGDVRVVAAFDPADFGAPPGEAIEVESWVSAVIRGNLAFDATSGRFVLTDLVSDVQVQLIGPLLPFSDAPVRAAIENDVRAAITLFARGAIGSLPLDTSIDGLGPVVGVSVSRSGFYYILGGSIE